MKNIFDTLYPYQKEVVDITDKNDRGIICLPTGTGKTYCQAAILTKDIQKYTNVSNIYVVNAPRIMLTYQLMKEFYGFLINNNIQSRMMFVHSGGSVDLQELEDIRVNADMDHIDTKYMDIGSWTSIEGIKEMMLKAKSQNLPLVLFSTYKSAKNIEIARKELGLDPIRMVFNDEAHYLVGKEYHDLIEFIQEDKEFFFTATMRNTLSNNNRGMQNVGQYGEVLYKMIPREAIELGKMVRPRMHILTTELTRKERYHNEDMYDQAYNNLIFNAYKEHSKVISNMGAKMLVSVKGTIEMEKFLKGNQYLALRNEGVNIFMVSSREEIGNNINGVEVKRSEFLKTLKEMGQKDDVKMVVFHYDILSEGIDVSGFTGMLPLRNLTTSKFLQTYGRTARLHSMDRKNIENGSLQPNELDKMVKPYAYVIIPKITLDNDEAMENFKNLINNLRDLDFNPIEDIIGYSDPQGLGEEELMEGLNEIERNNIATQLMLDLFNELEDTRIASLSTNNYINELDNVIFTKKPKKVKITNQAKLDLGVEPITKKELQLRNKSIFNKFKTIIGWK